jgi:hypothetical protein
MIYKDERTFDQAMAANLLVLKITEVLGKYLPSLGQA